MSQFARDTKVPADRSLAEIRKTIARYGADQFCHAEADGSAMIGFRAYSRIVRFHVVFPPLESFEKGGRRKRSASEMRSARDQAILQRWRCLALAIKAKLEVVESGIATFDEEFLSNIMTASGATVGATIVPQIQKEYKSGKSIPLLLGASV